MRSFERKERHKPTIRNTSTSIHFPVQNYLVVSTKTVFVKQTRWHARVQRIFEGYLGDIWGIFGGHLEEFWRTVVGNLEDVKRRLEGKNLIV